MTQTQRPGARRRRRAWTREAQWTRRHLLDVDDLSPRRDRDLLLETTDAMKEVLGRDIPRVPALRGRTIVTLFYEASTRTRASFELAGKALGADVINVAASGSSVEKGESLIDTVRTLQAIGADVLVMRHGSSGRAVPRVARNVQSSVINAGDGWHAHPTQALLDLYTMRTHLGDVRGQARSSSSATSRTAAWLARNIWALTAAGRGRRRSARRRRCCPRASRAGDAPAEEPLGDAARHGRDGPRRRDARARTS